MDLLRHTSHPIFCWIPDTPRCSFTSNSKCQCWSAYLVLSVTTWSFALWFTDKSPASIYLRYYRPLWMMKSSRQRHVGNTNTQSNNIKRTHGMCLFMVMHLRVWGHLQKKVPLQLLANKLFHAKSLQHMSERYMAVYSKFISIVTLIYNVKGVALRSVTLLHADCVIKTRCQKMASLMRHSRTR